MEEGPGGEAAVGTGVEWSGEGELASVLAYDPNEPPLNRETTHRLFGWQRDKGRGEMREMPVRPDGSIWSQYLESLLVPDTMYLRLYDSARQLCLTGEEAEAEARRAETRRAEFPTSFIAA